MPRSAALALVLIAVALVAWLALLPGEDELEAERAAALTRGAGASGGAASEMMGGERKRRAGAARSVGDARSVSPSSVEDRDADTRRSGVEGGEGSREVAEGSRPTAPPVRTPGRSPRAESTESTLDDGLLEVDARERGVPGEPSLADLEADAARVAESLGLMEPAELERRIDQQVDDSLPPDQLAQAREDARRQILADAAIVEDLVRSRYGADISGRQLRSARNMGFTLLSAQDTSYRTARLTGIVIRLSF